MISVTVACTAGEAARFTPEWRELAEDVREPNVFFEPFVLLPALAELAGGRDIRVLFLRDDAGLLVGVVPLQRHAGSLALPHPHFSVWRQRYCFLCTPLVRSGQEREVVEAAFGWLSEAGRAGEILVLSGHVRDGPFDRAVAAFAGERGHRLRTTGSYERAFVTGRVDPDAYLQTNVPSKRLAEMRRKRNRLAELGTVETVVAESPEQLAMWIPRFIELESRGWKGRAGTSMGTDPADRAFLTGVAAGGAGAHRADLLAVTVNGQPIAMGLTLRTGSAVFAFKIAYDEGYSRYSPGVLLAVEHLLRLLADPGVAWADSCADPNHPMLDSLWVQRRPIHEVTLARESWRTRLAGAIGGRALLMGRVIRAGLRALPAPIQRILRRVQAWVSG